MVEEASLEISVDSIYVSGETWWGHLECNTSVTLWDVSGCLHGQWPRGCSWFLLTPCRIRREMSSSCRNGDEGGDEGAEGNNGAVCLEVFVRGSQFPSEPV